MAMMTGVLSSLIYVGAHFNGCNNSFKLRDKLNLINRAKMVEAQPQEPTCSSSVKDDDLKISAMINWVVEHGGACNAETRVDKVTGVRGLYAGKAFTEMTEPIVRIPNKLIISPYHIKNQLFNGNWKDEKLFAFSEDYLTKRKTGEVTYD